MTAEERRRDSFELAVIVRMKESGYLEVEIRTECLGRDGLGYIDGSIDAYWHFWNKALDGVVVELPKRGYWGGYDQECFMEADEVVEAITDAGVRVKP